MAILLVLLPGCARTPEAETSRPQAPTSTGRLPEGLVPLGRNRQGFDEYRNEKDGAVLVRIPAGPFPSRSGDGDGRGGERQVELADFLIDRHEVSRSRYLRFMEATGAAPPNLWELQILEPDRPVVGVDWDEALAYCRWAGGRLPGAMQWEKAATGPEGRPYPWGSSPPAPGLVNCYQAVGDPGMLDAHQTFPVDTLEAGASPYGILHLAGNVDEWCWEGSDGGPPREPTDQLALRIVRGGSWMSFPEVLRVDRYDRWSRSSRNPSLGFRLMRSLEGEPGM